MMSLNVVLLLSLQFVITYSFFSKQPKSVGITIQQQMKSDLCNISLFKVMWSDDALSVCDIRMPQTSTINDASKYDFNALLCVALCDISERFCNSITDSKMKDAQSRLPKSLQPILLNFTDTPSTFCDSMKPLEVTQTLGEERKVWLTAFNTHISNVTKCKKECLDGGVNPLCALIHWLNDFEYKLHGLRHDSQDLESTADRLKHHSSKFVEKEKVTKTLHSNDASNSNSITLLQLTQENASHNSKLSNESIKSTDNGSNIVLGNINTVNQAVPPKEAGIIPSKQAESVSDKLTGTETETLGDQIDNRYTINMVDDAGSNGSDSSGIQTKEANNLQSSVNLKSSGTQYQTANDQGRLSKTVADPQAGPFSPTSEGEGQQTQGEVSEDGNILPEFQEGMDDSVIESNTNKIPVDKGSDQAAGESQVTGLESQSGNMGEHAKRVSENGKQDLESTGDNDIAIEVHPPVTPNTKPSVSITEVNIQQVETPIQTEGVKQTDGSVDAISNEDVDGTMDNDVEENSGKLASQDNYDSELNVDLQVLPNSVSDFKKSPDKVESNIYVPDRFVEAEDNHFFAYFLTMVALCIIGYLVFHNKQKILALAVEGRSRRGSRRRPNTSGYRKLDSNLEEAVTSTCNTSVTHVIY